MSTVKLAAAYFIDDVCKTWTTEIDAIRPSRAPKAPLPAAAPLVRSASRSLAVLTTWGKRVLGFIVFDWYPALPKALFETQVLRSQLA
jgi:hypothetical protein